MIRKHRRNRFYHDQLLREEIRRICVKIKKLATAVVLNTPVKMYSFTPKSQSYIFRLSFTKVKYWVQTKDFK